jgi:hypothetical protein
MKSMARPKGFEPLTFAFGGQLFRLLNLQNHVDSMAYDRYASLKIAGRRVQLCQNCAKGCALHPSLASAAGNPDKQSTARVDTFKISNQLRL